ncbi:UNVERIFIED_CONTAM: hypothetical protein NY100_03470 [Prevotella sp. 15_C9]
MLKFIIRILYIQSSCEMKRTPVATCFGLHFGSTACPYPETIRHHPCKYFNDECSLDWEAGRIAVAQHPPCPFSRQRYAKYMTCKRRKAKKVRRGIPMGKILNEERFAPTLPPPLRHKIQR